jgi:hypothetical protein
MPVSYARDPLLISVGCGNDGAVRLTEHALDAAMRAATRAQVNPDPHLFPSECPNCRQRRIQYGYEFPELAELLQSGQGIDAQCAVCGADWQLSVEERADIARAIGADRRA